MTLNLSEILSKMSSEFIGYSIYNGVILSYLFYIDSQVNYYVKNFPSASDYFILVPLLLASGFYLCYLFRNNRIKITNLVISLAILMLIGIWKTDIVRNDIYKIDHYSVFFTNYIIYLSIFIISSIFLWWITNYLREKGSRRPRWEGEIPYQSRIQFSNSIISKYAVKKGSRLVVTIEVPDASDNDVKEMRSALRELGLDENFEV